MTAFAGAYLAPETIERVQAQYRKPSYFEWRKSGTAFAIRGVQVVYILGFEDGIVKVGQTVDFLTRLSAHRSSPRIRGRALLCGWRLGTNRPIADEQVLMRLAAELGGFRMGRSSEWFTGVDVQALIARAEAELLDSSP